MGREIRKVPSNWQHPTSSNGGKQPMLDQTYADARKEWLDGLAKWESGNNPDREKYKNDDGTYQDYWEWHGAPPARELYRPWKDEDATWFQLWETVSEGTPVSPPFATKEELAQHLAVNGDDWDQKRCHDPSSCHLFGMELGKPGWGIERARRFVNGPGRAPSMIVTGGKVYEGTNAPD